MVKFFYCCNFVGDGSEVLRLVILILKDADGVLIILGKRRVEGGIIPQDQNLYDL